MKNSFLLILFASTALTGCTAQILNWELDKAAEVCKDRRGVSRLEVGGYLLWGINVTCNDGQVFYIQEGKFQHIFQVNQNDD